LVSRHRSCGKANNVIVLFTDFGLQGPYTGQMKAVLCQMAPGIPAVDLFADAPVGNPRASAYLLAAYAEWFAAGSVFLAVVDPGVGGARPPIILEADGRWYVGRAMAYSSWLNAVPQVSAAGTLTGNPSAFQPAFTGAISSRQLQPRSRGASHRRAGPEETMRLAGQTGRTICARLFTLIITAMRAG
jgi:hypothetical protein